MNRIKTIGLNVCLLILVLYDEFYLLGPGESWVKKRTREDAFQTLKESLFLPVPMVILFLPFWVMGMMLAVLGIGLRKLQKLDPLGHLFSWVAYPINPFLNRWMLKFLRWYRKTNGQLETPRRGFVKGEPVSANWTVKGLPEPLASTIAQSVKAVFNGSAFNSWEELYKQVKGYASSLYEVSDFTLGTPKVDCFLDHRGEGTIKFTFPPEPQEPKKLPVEHITLKLTTLRVFEEETCLTCRHFSEADDGELLCGNPPASRKNPDTLTDLQGACDGWEGKTK